MGLPLGVLLANFLMGSIEEEVFSKHHKSIEYTADIFIQIDDENKDEQLRLRLHKPSV